MRAAFGPPSFFMSSYFVSLRCRVRVFFVSLRRRALALFFFPSGAGRSLRSLGSALRARRSRAGRAAAQPGPDHGRTPRGFPPPRSTPTSPCPPPPSRAEGGRRLGGRGSSSTPPLLPGEERAGVRRGRPVHFPQTPGADSFTSLRRRARVLFISLDGGRSLRSLAYALRARRMRAVRAAAQPDSRQGQTPPLLPSAGPGPWCGAWGGWRGSGSWQATWGQTDHAGAARTEHDRDAEGAAPCACSPVDPADTTVRACETRNPLIQLVPSHPGESRQKF